MTLSLTRPSAQPVAWMREALALNHRVAVVYPRVEKSKVQAAPKAAIPLAHSGCSGWGWKISVPVGLLSLHPEWDDGNNF